MRLQRERTDALDALGNTTAAVGKGFAAGSAMLTALALLQSFMEEGAITSLNLTRPSLRRGKCLYMIEQQSRQ